MQALENDGTNTSGGRDGGRRCWHAPFTRRGERCVGPCIAWTATVPCGRTALRPPPPKVPAPTSTHTQHSILTDHHEKEPPKSTVPEAAAPEQTVQRAACPGMGAAVGGNPPPPLQGAQPMPSHRLFAGKCQPERHW